MIKPRLNYTPDGDNQYIVTVTLEANDFEFGKILTGTANRTISEIAAAKAQNKNIYAAVMGSYCPFIDIVNGIAYFGVMQDFDNVLLDFDLIGFPDSGGEYWTCKAVYYPVNTDIPGVNYDLDGGTP